MTPHLLLIPAIIFAIITYASAFEQGIPVCDNYVQNTYLYSVTYLLLLTYFIALLNANPKLMNKIDMMYVLPVVIANLGIFFAMMYTSPKNVLLKHILSLFYIVTASFLLTLVFMYFDSKAVVSAAVLSVVLFSVLSIFAFRFQRFLSSRISVAFFIVFVVMVIAELLIGLLFPSSVFEKVVILAVLMLICYLVLVRTKRMIENAETCRTPDYVNESIGFIVSFQNIILRVLQLRNRRR